MKNSNTLLCSLIGGAILGSALTILLKSKSAASMREKVHGRILSEIEHLREHMCRCKDGDCSMDSMEGIEKSEQQA
ncbi:MAG: hypothetical protein SNH28_02645 [Rikenellaceae bacterium]